MNAIRRVMQKVRLSPRRAWERGSVELGVAGVATALVLGGVVGNGVASTAVDMFDGLTWLTDSSSGQVVQVNPVTGRAEARLQVTAGDAQLGIAQSDGWLIIDDATTGEVIAIDLATLTKSGQRSGAADGQTKVLVGGGQAFVVDLEQGTVSAVDPLTLQDLGEPYRGDEPFAEVVVDETGQVWVLDEDADLVTLRYSEQARRFIEESSRPVANAGSESRLVPHEEGVTVFAPEGPVVAQFGTDAEFATPLFEVSGPVVVAAGAPADLSPGSFPESSTVAMVSGEDVLEVNVAALGCGEPGAPAVFSERVYVPCIGDGKVVVLGSDGMQAGPDIITPDGQDPELVVDDGRLLVSTPDSDQVVVVEPDGSTRVIDVGGGDAEVFDPSAPPEDVDMPQLPPSLRPPSGADGSGGSSINDARDGPDDASPESGRNEPGSDGRDRAPERDGGSGTDDGNRGSGDRDRDSGGGDGRDDRGDGGSGDDGGWGDGPGGDGPGGDGGDESNGPGTDGGAENGTDDGADEGSDDGTDTGSDDGADEGTDTGSDDGTDDGADEGTDDGTDEGADDGTGDEEDEEPQVDPPQPASNVQVGEAAGEYVVTWDPPAEAPDSFRVEPDEPNAGPSETVNADASSVVVSDLRPGTSIRYRVVSVGEDGQQTASEWSSPFDVQGETPDPAAPAGVTAQSYTPGTVDVTWSNSNPAVIPDEYRIVQVGGVAEPVQVGSVGSLRLDYVVEGLAEGAEVSFRVDAVIDDRTAESDVTAPVTVMETEKTPPGAPRNVGASARDRTDAQTVVVDVSWSAPADDGGAPVTEYRVSGGGESVSAGGTSAALTINCAGQSLCTDGGSVNVSVVAVNSEGSGDAGTATATVSAPPAPDPELPGTPENVGASARDRTDAQTVVVDVSWSAPADDGGAAVTEYRVSGGGASTDSGGTSAALTINCAGQSLCTDGGSVQVEVRAVNSEGAGAAGTATATVDAPPPQITPPSAPQNVSAQARNRTDAGTVVIDVSWAAPADDGGASVTYDVAVSGGGASGSSNGVSGTSATVTLSCSGQPLCADGGTASVSVTAKNQAGSSGADETTASVDAPPPPPPSNGDSVVTWVESRQPGEYEYDVPVVVRYGIPEGWAYHGSDCELVYSGRLNGTDSIPCEQGSKERYIGGVPGGGGTVTAYIRTRANGSWVTSAEVPGEVWPRNTWGYCDPTTNICTDPVSQRWPSDGREHGTVPAVHSQSARSGGGLASPQTLAGVAGLGLAGAMRALRLRASPSSRSARSDPSSDGGH
ncbi:fibronectin type III domain-containing protein [Phytoactinopolyspora endophytica]|uniref:fibronectin type III domain-containing protein n=1 Tax=Phytoactinopolyspora endophytica TaxID=1642495 RepID=UPI0013EE3F0D|nr:fibronectin type III domain-containing protein [Phytoactinopolyspora endophytica]